MNTTPYHTTRPPSAKPGNLAPVGNLPLFAIIVTTVPFDIGNAVWKIQRKTKK
jgi:hypothetical protein